MVRKRKRVVSFVSLFFKNFKLLQKKLDGVCKAIKDGLCRSLPSLMLFKTPPKRGVLILMGRSCPKGFCMTIEETKEKENSGQASDQETMEEKKVTQQGTEEQTPATEASTEETKESATQSEIDYKAENERLLKQLSQAEHVIEKTKKKLKEKETEETFEEEDEVSEVDIDAKVDEKVNARLAELVQDTIDSTLDDLSSSEDEKNLIKLYYDKKIVKSGFSKTAIKEDMELAKALANKKTIFKEREEMRKTKVEKQGVSQSPSGNNQDKQDASIESRVVKSLSKEELAFLEVNAKRLGMTRDAYLKKFAPQLLNN